jgi:hypothetical protein
MKFGEALEAVKAGQLIKRTGWNGKNQFVYLLKGNDISKSFGYGYGEYEFEPTFTSTLVLKNAQNLLVIGWVPSMGDLFAEDWEVV